MAGFITLVLVGGVFFFISSFRGGGDDIGLELAPETTDLSRGVPFEISLNINNQTSNILRGAKLTLNLGSGLISLNSAEDNELVQEELGEIKQNTITRRVFVLVPTGEIDSSQKIVATLSYFLGRSEFERRATETFVIKGESLEVVVEKPDQVLSGSTLEVTIRYNNNSDFDFKQLNLRANYPSSFKFLSAELEPDSLNNFWRLGTLRSGSSGELKIRGLWESIDGGSSNFEAVLFVEFLGQSYEVARGETNFQITESPIGIQITINGNPDHVARIGKTLQYGLIYTNKSGIALNDVKIDAQIAGELFQFSTLETNARIDPITNSMSWNKDNTPSLQFLEPGEKGQVTFTISLADEFSINRLNDKNFILNIKAQIESPSVPYYLEAEKTSAATVLKTKVAGQTKILVKALYRDAASGILNTGVLPPRVGQATQYSIHWSIKNYATDVSNVTIKSKLPNGVRWTGIVKSNGDSIPLYDKKTREIVWKVENVSATKGVISTPPEVIFQVEAVPEANMLGRFQPLLETVSLTALDGFTGVTLTASALPIDSSLPSDPTTSPVQGIVIK